MAAVFLFALAACGSSGSSANSKTSSTRDRRATTSTTTAASVASKEAIAAYNAMWQDMVAAAATADYQAPRLANHAAGDALSVLVRGLYVNQQRGLVSKGEPVTHPKATSATPPVEPTKVAITDCFDATNWLYYRADTGELQNDNPGGKHLTTATVAHMEGAWKVTQLLVGGLGTC